jgi:hypothetical protein
MIRDDESILCCRPLMAGSGAMPQAALSGGWGFRGNFGKLWEFFANLVISWCVRVVMPLEVRP